MSPTNLPEDFQGTGKPRSTPNPKIPTRVNIPTDEWVDAEESDEDYPLIVKLVGWALVIGIGSVLVAACAWVVALLVATMPHA